MILPIYAGLERIPNSLLEASADLGGRAGMTFRRVILPLVFPALVAGSIFTFSLTLGDYITPDLVADAKFIGNVIYDNSSLGNLPLAAGYSLLPIVVMTVYLLVARRFGAFESL
jgi:putative spermidine/putrescine transport system permease protein